MPCNTGMLESFSVVAVAGYLSFNLDGGSKGDHARTNMRYFLCHLILFLKPVHSVIL